MSAGNLWRRESCVLRIYSVARTFALVSLLLLVPGLLHSQSTSIRMSAGTPLWIQLLKHTAMKAGEPLEGRLLYTVYVQNQIAIPAGTVLRGRVIRLDSDRSRRIHSRLRGDFTPFHVPVVQFDELVLPDGTLQPVVSHSARDGVPVLHLSPAPSQKKSGFLARQLAQAKQQVKDSAALFTAPGRGDRLVQFIYTQLPYHPQRIETATTWTVELAQPLDLELRDSVTTAEKGLAQKGERTAGQIAVTAAPPAVSEQNPSTEWQLRAYLQQTISSATEKPGDHFQALVAEPVFNPDHRLVVPEGSLIVGEITQAKPARSFGRQGKLRFKFRELRFPDGFSEPVEGTLAGIDSNKAANLQIDSEGGIQQKSQNRVIAPLALTLLAGRAFDDDGSRVAHSAVASNGFGIIGRVVGIVASSRNVAAGIGIYGAALSFYDLWLAHGHNVVFAKNTRIEITTTPHRSPLTP